MKFVDDMKIGKKLIGGFLIVLLILATVAVIGYMNMSSLADRSSKMYNGNVIAITQLSTVDTSLQHMRAEIYRYVYVPESRVADLLVEQDMEATIKKELDAYRAGSLTAEDKASLAQFDSAFADYITGYKALFAAADKNDEKAVNAALAAGSPLITSRNTAVSAITTLVNSHVASAKALNTEADALATSASMMMIVATIIGFIIALTLALYLSKSITSPIDDVKRNLDELSKGHLGRRMKLSRRDEIGEMAATMDTFSEDLQKNVVGSMKKIADGDLNVMLMAKDPQDEITPALMNTVTSLQGLVTETKMLTEAGTNGKLDVRGNADKFNGGYKEIVMGINNTLDAIIGPLNMTAEYMDRISKGDVPAKITDQYKGDFNEIKNNLNQCIDAINLLVRDTQVLAAGAVDGKLDVRADASKHQGDFRKTIEGVNHTLDAIIGPLNMAAEYMDRISKGDVPAKITDQYKGDFNEIKNNLNQCIDAVNLLVKDAKNLSLAAVDGKLDVRADASKHQGDFRKIIEGVNDTLDSVIGPLNVAAEYMDRISKGDVPAKITDQYKGDFNEIKNNLNQCIDGLGGLVEASQTLKRMAVNDHSKGVEGNYLGVFADVKTSVNTVQERVNHIADSLAMISNGDLSEADVYRKIAKRSEKDKIVPGFIRTFDALQNLTKDANMLSESAVAGKLTTRADATKHHGEYRKIIEGVNETLDAVTGPLNEAMRVADTYAKADFTARYDNRLQVQGDFIKFKKSLNNVGIQVSKALLKVNQQINQLSAGAQEATASVEEVSAGSAQIAKNAGAVSLNAEKSGEGIKQVLKAMEDLSTTVQEVATKAEAVAQIAKKSEELSQKGSDLASKADKGMVGITKSSTEVNEIILDIKSQMDKIGDIVVLIANLANQTNLLALNAAIEAARAGEAGRGFAVVATEVKSLAEESENSAAKIRLMIGELQKQTQRAVENVEKSSGEVKEGGIALSQTLEVFNKIVASIDEINRNINDVAASAEEQAASVEEVTASVNEVNALVNDTAKEATDSAAASEESSAAIDQITKIVQNVTVIADQVTKEVSKFRIKAGSDDSASEDAFSMEGSEESPVTIDRISKSGSSSTARAA
ncbi:MAG: methyl-accepting chemotaxis protein [Methanoregula sp.]|jgi:methyl-accepting chemotaxis protein